MGEMHVFVLALGPVQDFIAAARRTRDLWFGSWMLSELARAAGEAIESSYGTGSLIFPASGRLKDPDATFANKIVARISGEPEEAGRAARAAIDRRLDELQKDAFEKILGHPAFSPNRGRAQRQIADLVEVQWASAPEGAGGYHAARNEAERLLGARKNSRLFQPVTWGAEVPKSSIDGQRESVIDEAAFDDQTPRQLYDDFRIDPAERLCGVSLLKRLGKRKSPRYDEHHFLSTGQIAAGPLLERLAALQRDPEADTKLRAAWERIEVKLDEVGADLSEQRVFVKATRNPYLDVYDAGLLFESRLPDLFPELQEPRERRRRADPLVKEINAFLHAAGITTLCPYYAVLHADGDRMGATIDEIKDFRRHQALSDSLSVFADSARKIVEVTHRGELVYAGGDDVLAFLPLHRAVACARALAEDFAERLAPFGFGGAAPTLSVGIAVAHFLDPLQAAVRLARRAEAKAKEARDKAAPIAKAAGVLPPGGFAISFDKRSGPALHLTGHWGELDVQLETLTTLHAEEEIPDKAGYELRELARLVDGTEGAERENLSMLVHKEAERILSHKQPKRGDQSEIKHAIRKELSAMLEVEGPLSSLADRLIGARLLAEALLQSQLPAPKEVPA